MDWLTKLRISILLYSPNIFPKDLEEWSPKDPKNSLELIINPSTDSQQKLLWFYLEHNNYTFIQGYYSLLGTPEYDHQGIIQEHQKIIDAKLQEIGKYLQTRYTGEVRAWTRIPKLKQINLTKPTFPIEIKIPEEDILFAALEIKAFLGN